MKTIGIIPARYGSSRFPGKPLVDIVGKTMIQRVYEQAEKSKKLEKVIVATDDKRIFDHVSDFGGTAVLTSSNHSTGTERCAEAVLGLNSSYDLVINIQGDEPFIQPAQIDDMARFMENHPELNIGTLAVVIKDEKSVFNPNHIKVVFTKGGKALYFSRSPVPFLRGVEKGQWQRENQFFKHIGMYAYKIRTLKKIVNLPETKLEKAESLEQLRWMEHGYSIGVMISDQESPSIDTPEDLQILLQKLSS